MEDLKAIEEIELFPQRFILDVEKQPNCTNNLNRKIRTALFKTENSTMMESVSFKLLVPIPITKPWPRPTSCTFSIEESLDSTMQESSSTFIPSHHCDKNKPEPKDLMKYSEKIACHWLHLLLGIPKGEVSTIDITYKSIREKCFYPFTTWLDRILDPCWCKFIRALDDVGLSGVAEEAKAHLKSSEIKVDEHDKVNLYQLVQFLNDVPDCNLKYFIIKLLPKNTALKVIKDITQGEKKSKGDITKKICQPFLKERDPSWAKVHKALIETKCIDLAYLVEASFL